MESPNDTRSSVRRWRELLASERDAESLYTRLAGVETGERQQIFKDLALVAMFIVGATIGALNGRSAIRMGLRQMFVGALAAAVTYGVGHLIGAHVS